MTLGELLSALLLPALCVGGAVLIWRRERASFAAYQAEPAERDLPLFVYSRVRLRRRLTGACVLAAVGLTLLAWDLVRPETPTRATLVVVALILEVLLLVFVAIADLIETARRPPLPPARGAAIDGTATGSAAPRR